MQLPVEDFGDAFWGCLLVGSLDFRRVSTEIARRLDHFLPSMPRPIADGEIRTACQQACPTRAIVFGDLNTPESRVLALKSRPQHYVLLEELGTRPRTTYLARLRNPNPELGDE